MALIDINYRIVSGVTRILFDNYNVSSYKLHKLYRNPVYKKVIDFLVSAVSNDAVKSSFNDVVPILENMSPTDFEMLCYLYKSGKLENFLALVRIGSQGI